MRVIKPQTVETWASAHAAARSSLANWMTVVKTAGFADLRQSFANADQVKVKSGRIVVVFNIAGNRFRLIAAVHYDRTLLFALRFLTHAEYSKDKWKDEL